MKKMFLSAFAVAALAFVGCTEDATNDLAQENGGAAVELHEMTFEAEIEQPTRTSLVDPGDGTSYVCWDADDVVGVVADDEKIYKATIKTGVGSSSATFTVSLPEGIVPVGAFYPYQFARDTKSSASFDGSAIKLKFPELQTYKAGSVFGDDENVMIGVFGENANGAMCQFKSVMGAFELKFTGSQTVYGVTVKGSDHNQKISGVATVDFETAAISMGTGTDSYSFATLDVPEVVTLNSTKATSFYVLVPAGTYNALQIGVLTEDGSYTRIATKAHTVKAGEILPINCGNLDTMIDEGAAVNLSANDYANCYLYTATSAKTYVFDTKMVDGTDLTKHVNDYLNQRYVTGTGDEAAPGYPGQCEEADILAHYAWLVWTEDTKVAYDIQFDKAGGKIYFKGASAGNARIMLGCNPIKTHTILSGLTRPDNALIWGWHIWGSPETPGTSVTAVAYSTKDANGDGAISRAELQKTAPIGFMDRNLGATWTPKTVSEVNGMTAAQAADMLGLYFQAGNLHPYPRPVAFGSATDSFDNWARAQYQYGASEYTQTWTASGASKSSIDENWQFPFYRFSKTTKAGDDFYPIDNHIFYKADGKTINFNRNSWVLTDISCGVNQYDLMKATTTSGVTTMSKVSRETFTGPILWDGTANNKLSGKKNYDPCPQGWKMPHRGNVYQTALGGGFKFIENDGDAVPAANNATQKTFQTVPSKKFNNIPVGLYISYNGTNVDLWPSGGYMGTGVITFNASGNIGYYWAAQYYHQSNGEAFTNSGVKMCLSSTKGNTCDYNWPQTSTPYQIRCVKGTK